jgi:hypothetical protein
MATNVRVMEVQDLKRVGRKLRKPSHSFTLRVRPWQIQPFAIAPVLPGETMKNALLQMRCVSSPVKSPLVGWWAESFLFYVKLRDLNERDNAVALLMTNTAIPDNTGAVAMVEMYDRTGKYSYVRACLKRVVDTYFRTNEEFLDQQDYKIGNLPVARASVIDNWTDSLISDSDVSETETETMTGEASELGEDEGPIAGYTDEYNHWLAMRDMGLVKVEFADWIKQFGVVPPQDLTPKEDLHKPELLRYIREWTYPSNTVDPVTGNPSSALSWSVAERADKDRFFQEPGFLFGCCVFRPKIYLKNQIAGVSQFLDSSISWLPALLNDEPYTSLKKFLTNAGPLNAAGSIVAEGYWVDMKDLFLHGDQFANFAFDGAASDVALPVPNTADPEAVDDPPINKRYPVAADADALFVGASPSNIIRVDGRIDFSILSRLDETTK